ncbi:MAG: hypothetical protein H0T48_17205 [Gemmatimonadaceae bacterium]|nr:hypothetical protein [Gemmatimonadaceae bacterium]
MSTLRWVLRNTVDGGFIYGIPGTSAEFCPPVHAWCPLGGARAAADSAIESLVRDVLR